MTFEEWFADLAGELDPDTMYLRCWQAAQAQCSAGPWRPIAEAAHDRDILIPVTNGYLVATWCPDCNGWVDATTSDHLERFTPTHFAELHEVTP